MTELAQQILNYRAKERISQREFAERAGLSLQTVCNIETGQQNPGKLTVAKIMLLIEDKEE